jgi:hypothetical protein
VRVNDKPDADAIDVPTGVGAEGVGVLGSVSAVGFFLVEPLGGLTR